MKKAVTLSSIIIILLMFSPASTQDEWGDVDFTFNYYTAKDKALDINKPVFLQFNEVPG